MYDLHATIIEDGGTGRMIRDPVSYRDRGKQPVDQQPNLDTGAPVVGSPVGGGSAIWGANPPSGDTIGDGRVTLPIAIRLPDDPPQTPQPQQPQQPTAADTATQFGPSKGVLDAISATAANAGANQMLGPQYSYGPGTTTTSSGGGSPILIVIAIAIVGVLAFLHFRKKHAEHS